MRPRLRVATIVTLGLLVTVAASLVAQRNAAPAASSAAQADVTARIVASAQAVLATLDDAGRMKVQFPFEGPQKTRWSNLPTGAFHREGLRMGDITPQQRAAVMTLLSVALSEDGYRKVTDIMRGDEVLRETGGGRGPRGGGPPPGFPNGPPPGRGPGDGRGRGGPGGGGAAFGEAEYYLAFLGTPSATAPWMLQFGGHHLAINLTLAGSEATMAPSLPAAQPASYTVEGRTVRPLGNENDKAFALVNALDASQRGRAILPYRVADLVLGPGQDGRTIQPEGLRADAMSAPQQAMLLDLIHEWVGIMNDAFSEPRMGEIRSKLRDTYFAWSGPTTNGSEAYFRIQGPTLVIEYAPQGSVDHIHTIYRDPTNDYGVKLARR
ncbi:MAG TPA: DUF3500 domain-containing protein [Vicinamibacterales bacterium]|nr:DUF3500 domain-containing protein [Vicinamibacterales bacterium]